MAALKGTEVRLHMVPTMATPGGRLPDQRCRGGPIDGRERRVAFGSVQDRQGRLLPDGLDGPHGEKVAATPQYTIDVLNDMPPSISFTKPGRDTTATPVDEVFVEAKADDDFGVKSLDLVYPVNGGPAQTKRLFSAGAKPMAEVSAGHTFFLEELGLEAGDFLSYFAKAVDNDSVQGPKSVQSDLYFLQIRAFRKDYKPAMSQGGGGGGGGGGEVGALSQQQRRIIAATFNVVRDRQTFTADKFRESIVFLTLAQSRLREQVEGLVARMNSRLVEPDPALEIAHLLPQAATEMRGAEGSLQAQKASDALPPEQRALKFLQQAEQEYEMQVSVNRGGGGGGGGAGSMARRSPTCSSSKWTSWPTSTRPCSGGAAERRPADRRAPNISRNWLAGSSRRPSASGAWPRPDRAGKAAEAPVSVRSPRKRRRPPGASNSWPVSARSRT